ncbi:uncharacterized protein LOC127283312 [Leptopilina boulardi]|uniref:uncharacterized protein LOC127283312 n=1 Tax=Leptopilina boulardi TaxID=63433 RepID=UPI0021F572FE|nr:uncharacterized protein LOC127283312 [Leptopilina boulardi]
MLNVCCCFMFRLPVYFLMGVCCGAAPGGDLEWLSAVQYSWCSAEEVFVFLLSSYLSFNSVGFVKICAQERKIMKGRKDVDEEKWPQHAVISFSKCSLFFIFFFFAGSIASDLCRSA